jgi:hypothetical protein
MVVKSAFLNQELKEEFYPKQPLGFGMTGEEKVLAAGSAGMECEARLHAQRKYSEWRYGHPADSIGQNNVNIQDAMQVHYDWIDQSFHWTQAFVSV